VKKVGKKARMKGYLLAAKMAAYWVAQTVQKLAAQMVFQKVV